MKLKLVHTTARSAQPEVAQLFKMNRAGASDIFMRISSSDGRRCLPHAPQDAMFCVNIETGDVLYWTPDSPVTLLTLKNNTVIPV